MKRIKFIQIVIFALLACSCEKAKDSYFDDVAQDDVFEGSGQLLYDYLAEQPTYSKFTSLLKETEMDKVLKGDNILTVWAIPDSLFPSEILETLPIEKVLFIKNHINSMGLLKSNLERDRYIFTLASKTLHFDYQDSVSTIGGVQVRRMNQLCKNGVVHEVAGYMTPRKNVYEHILTSGDKYSVFRDSIMAYNDTVFMPELSIPSGIDEVGSTVYSDSVFVYDNPYLPPSLTDDLQKMTYLLPSNDAIKLLMRNVSTYFQHTLKREFTQQDTVKVMQWLMKGVLHHGEITNYGAVKKRMSAYDISWRTDKQIVDLNYTQCSNGCVYELTGILYPKYEYMETLVFRPHFILDMPDRDQYLTVSGLRASDGFMVRRTAEGSEQLHVHFGDDYEPKDGYVEFSSVVRRPDGTNEHVKVLPGIYKFAASYRTRLQEKQTISVVVNGELESSKEYDVSESVNNNFQPEQERGKYEHVPLEYAAKDDAPWESNGLFTDKFVVKDEWGYDHLRFRITNTGGSYHIILIYFLLEPSEDNY